MIPGVPKKLSPFKKFHNNDHCLVLSDVNSNQKTSKIWMVRKSYAGEVLEKVGNLAMEICSTPSMFYITGVKTYNRLSMY